MPRLGDFRKSVWKKDLKTFQKNQRVKRDAQRPIEGVEVPDSHLVTTFPEAPSANIGSRQILVQSEYNEAEQEAVLSSGQKYSDVFVVTGQPGIGSPPLSLRCP